MKRLLRIGLVIGLLTPAIPVLVFAVQPAQALENGLARTPQLGWNDWNSFGCNINDGLIRQAADTMVSSGMAAAGYQYVNIDDCWSEKSRDGSGNLVPDHIKFPNGIKGVADYVHGKGLKLGIYSSAGLTTCAGYPASLGNEQRDVNTWASWGVDYLKYDNCGQTNGISGQTRYTSMRDAVARSSRPMLFAICNWGNDNVKSWGPATGNSWRTTGDIAGNWNSVMGILDQQPNYAPVSKPGAWNDPDMLEVGHGLTDTESRAHFSLWALMNAPLLAGNDIRTMSAASRTILTNTEVIGVNQDWGGRQGNRTVDNGDSEVWTKPMANGSVAVVLLNRGGGTATISTSASQVGLGSASSYSVRDLWAHTDATSTGNISASVPSHGAAMYIVARSGNTTTTTTTTTAGVTTTTTGTTTTTSTTTTTGGATSTTTSTTGGGGGNGCTAAVVPPDQWPGGFVANITVTAGGAPITGWKVTLNLPSGAAFVNGWNANFTGSTGAIQATNVSYNGGLGSGQQTTFGFQGTGTVAGITVSCSS